MTRTDKASRTDRASGNPPRRYEIGQLSTQQQYGDSIFPRVYLGRGDQDSASEIRAWLKASRTTLLAEATRHGAVLFRQFPLSSLEDFDAFVSGFELPCFTYEDSLSNAVRINHTPRVFSANEAPPEVDIHLHHEMAQTPIYPRRLFFFCRQAADSGGATSLCRSDVLWERLSREAPDFAETCRQKGLRYTHTMPAQEDLESGMGRSWQSTFSAKTREQAEARMTELGYHGEWLDDDCLRVTSPRLPAVRELDDGRMAFFNQLIAAFSGWRDRRNDPGKAITFGDGTTLDPKDAEKAVRLGEELSFNLPWQTGDVALIDNFVTMHGRRHFTGTRSVLASFTT